MQIYDRPTKSLIADWAEQHLKPGQPFKKSAVVQWFAQQYPKIKRNTVLMHVDGMSVNNLNRRHHPSIKPGSGHDLFYKLGPDQYRLWVPDSDGPARYKEDIEKQNLGSEDILDSPPADEPEDAAEGTNEFAYERDLRNYLVKNLTLVEPGLRLHEEEGITGVEYQAGGRFIDILAVDKTERFVVIELKVSRGYDRVIGQLLRYMAWVDENMEAQRRARGLIVAKEITSDLKLACSRIEDVQLIEYEISFKLRPV